MFARQSYTFNEADIIGIVEVILSGPVREDALVIITGGEAAIHCIIIMIISCI